MQTTDYFPTLLDLAQLPQPQSVKFDGISFAPALRGESLTRDTVFTHFPHGGRSDIDGFRPATWVRRGDWKLIRFFADNDDGTDKLELYNLREDLGETKNLAIDKPELAAELNALISGFLKDTDAVIPVKNPGFSASAPASAQDPLLGWKPRQCEASAANGILSVKAKGADPFLGFAAGKLAANAKLRFRIKSHGGSGKVAWLSKPDATSAPKPTPFMMKAGEFTEITASIPAPGDQGGIIRLYLPTPAELDWIELRSGDDQPRRWDF